MVYILILEGSLGTLAARAVSTVQKIDLIFGVRGEKLPTDHGYALYSALSGIVPALHNGELSPGIGAISGQYLGDGLQALNDRSYLRIRIPSDQIPAVLPLAGKPLDIAGHRIRLGVPRVIALTPAPALVARLVTIKGFTEPGPFLEAVRRKLAELEIAGEPGIPFTTAGSHSGQPRRRILRIKDKRVVGFALQVTGLTAEESLCLQEQTNPATAFSRRKMGCGFFLPMRPTA
jgi:CRISPR-associated protein Cas6